MLYVVRAPIIHDGAVYAPGAAVVLDEAQAQLIPWAVVKAAHGEPTDTGKGAETPSKAETDDEPSPESSSNFPDATGTGGSETPSKAGTDDESSPESPSNSPDATVTGSAETPSKAETDEQPTTAKGKKKR